MIKTGGIIFSRITSSRLPGKALKEIYNKTLIERVRKAESAIGKVNYDVSEKDKLRRRSIFVVKNIKKDEKF